MQNRTNGVFTIPNFLTLSRIVIAFSILWLLGEADGRSSFLVFAFALCVIAAITDGLDGYLARHLKQKSDFGREFDPVADKILIYCVLFPLSLKYALIPLWLVIVIMARDISVVALAKVMLLSSRQFNVTFFAKAKTMIQDLFILSGILLLVFHPVGPLVLEVWDALVYIIGILAVMTLFHYGWVHRESIRFVMRR